MYCPECGAKNADDAVFCENCGADISKALGESSSAQQSQEKKEIMPTPNDYSEVSQTYPSHTSAVVRERKPLKTSTKVITAAVLVVLVAGFALFQAGKSMTSPEKIAMDYFSAVKAQNWNGVYSFLDTSENGFLTEKNFVKAQKKTNAEQSIENYSVLSEAKKKSGTANSDQSGKNAAGGLVEEVTVQYTTHGSASPETKVVTLVKQPDKKWLFFDTWKVSPVDYITPEVNVTVPSGMTAYIDDVKLDDKYKSTGDSANSTSSDSSSNTDQNTDSQVKYTVKNIFSGNYTLKVVSPYTEDVSKSTDIGESNHDFEFNQFTIKKEILDSVSKQPEEIIKALYASALAGKDYDSVSSYFVPDSGNANDSFKDTYDQIKNLIANGTNGGFRSIDFSNFDPELGNSDGQNNMVINVSTKFDYSYTAVDASYDPTTPAPPYNGKDTAQVDMEFKLVKGKWLVDSMNNINLSYSNNSSVNSPIF